MPYNSVIGSGDVAGLIPIEYSAELMEAVISEKSHVMRLARRLRNMNERQTKMPVLSALATAYFLEGDTDLIQTSEVNWTDVNVYAKDLGVLVPVPRNVLDDATIPIWDEIRPDLETACGVAIDLAVLYGSNKPQDWPAAIVAAANSAGHAVAIGTGADLYEDILGEDGVFAKVETDGFGVTGNIAHLVMLSKLRGVRTADGQPIFYPDPTAGNSQGNLWGTPIYFPKTGAGNASYPLVSGDWTQLVYSVRLDMEFEVFKEGVIQDAAGNIVYNLMQQRMAALLVVMRLGFALPNPVNRVNPDENTRYPFAVLTA